MTDTANYRNFEQWCLMSGLDRDFVRRNYAAIRARFERTPDTPLQPLDRPTPKPRDRYDELL